MPMTTHKILLAVGVVLMLAGCNGVRSPYPPNAPSPLYGGAPCPGSATSASGGEPTPYDCIPGGREGGSRFP